MKDVLKFSDNIQERLGSNKHESLVLNGLGHFDTSDRYLYDQYLMQYVDLMLPDSKSNKSEGNHSELHEATALWQIEYLYKIGFSEPGIVDIEKIRDLLNVWDPIVKYVSPLSDDLEANQPPKDPQEENTSARFAGCYSIKTGV